MQSMHAMWYVSARKKQSLNFFGLLHYMLHSISSKEFACTLYSIVHQYYSCISREMFGKVVIQIEQSCTNLVVDCVRCCCTLHKFPALAKVNKSGLLWTLTGSVKLSTSVVTTQMMNMCSNPTLTSQLSPWLSLHCNFHNSWIVPRRNHIQIDVHSEHTKKNSTNACRDFTVTAGAVIGTVWACSSVSRTPFCNTVEHSDYLSYRNTAHRQKSSFQTLWREGMKCIQVLSHRCIIKKIKCCFHGY